MKREISFKEWMMFLEGSFSAADIPAFFYVGCYFSEDFVKHYSFTPPEAACSLVGLEGITTNSSTGSSFSNGAILKMPGKAVIDINKISKSMYNNPHYMASMGFRAPRRLKSGSDPLKSGKKNYTTESLLQSVVSSVISKIISHFPEMGNGYSNNTLKNIQDGSVVTSQQIVEILKKCNRTCDGILGKKKYRTVKHARKRHEIEIPIKNIRNADDLARRLMIVLRVFLGDDVEKLKRSADDAEDTKTCGKCSEDYPENDDECPHCGASSGYDPGDYHDCSSCGEPIFSPDSSEDSPCPNCGYDPNAEPEPEPEPDPEPDEDEDEDEDKDDEDKEEKKEHFFFEDKKDKDSISLLTSWVRDASLAQGSGYEGEKEWIMKRQPLSGILGKSCPHCRKFNQAKKEDEGKEISCWNCNQPITVSKDLETGGRPVLHVPIGSTVLINEGHGFPDWAEKYIDKPAAGEYPDTNKKFKMLLDKTKLYKKLNCYVKDGKDISSLSNERPYDPERQQTQEEIKRVLTRGRVANQRMLEKLMAAKGVPAVKLNDILARWQNAGVIKVEDGRVQLLDQDFDEDSVAVYEFIKGNETANEKSIEKATSVSGNDLKKTLESLMQKNKIQLLSNGYYDVKLSDEEIKTITEPEQKVLDALKGDGVYTDPYNFSIGIDSTEVKAVLRNLLRKGKIFKSKITRAYRATISEDEPLTKPEVGVITYLKKWPISDMFSMKKAFKNEENLNKALDGLLARNLVTVDSQDNVHLVKNKTPDHDPAAKGHSKSAATVMKLCGRHFLSSHREIAKIEKWDMYQTEHYIRKLVEKGLIAWSKSPYRLVPTDASYVHAQTDEEKTVLKLGEKVSSFKRELVEKMIQKDVPAYSSTGYLLEYMVKNQLLKSSYHPLEEELYYHAIAKPFIVDTSKYEKAIFDALEEANKPLGLESIQEKVIYKTKRHLSEQAINNLLQKMLSEITPKIKSEEDFTNTAMYFLAHAAGPKKAEDYFDEVKKTLEEKPLDYGTFHTNLQKSIKENYYATEAIIRKAIDAEIVKNAYSDVIDAELYYLPGQKIPSMDDYKEFILKIIEEKPATSQEVYSKMLAQGINIKSSPIASCLNNMTSEDLMVRTKAYDGKYYYHMKHHDPLAEQTKKYEDIIIVMISEAKNNEITAKEANSMLYYNHKVNYDDGLKIIKGMIAKKIIYVKEGDIDDEESQWDTLLTSNEVDPATVVKNPLMAKAEPVAMEFMKIKKGGPVKASELGGVIKAKVLISMWSQAKKIVQELITAGKLHVVTPMDDYDFWDQQITTAAVPQVPQPQLPSDPWFPASVPAEPTAAEPAAEPAATTNPAGWGSV